MTSRGWPLQLDNRKTVTGPFKSNEKADPKKNFQ